MKVTTAALPLLPLFQRLLPGLPGLPGLQRLPSVPGLSAVPGLPELASLPGRLTGLSLTLLKASALEAAILAGHLLLYPSGIIQERHPAQTLRPQGAQDPCRHLRPRGSRPRPAPGRPAARLHRQPLGLPAAAPQPGPARQARDRVAELLPLTCDIRTAAELLGRHIEEICERTGSERVDVVGHSLGGLIARYYVQRLGGDLRVRTLVTLGTPHTGTKVVPLANAHPIVRQMRPGSAVIEELTRPAPGCRTRFVSFWSDLDRVMDPLETACLDHPDLSVQNVRVSGIGHLALPVHPAVATGIRQALDTAGPETAGQTDAEPGKRSGGLTVA